MPLTEKELMSDEEFKGFYKKHWPLLTFGAALGASLFFVSSPMHLVLFALYGVKFLPNNYGKSKK